MWRLYRDHIGIMVQVHDSASTSSCTGADEGKWFLDRCTEPSCPFPGDSTSSSGLV